MKFVLKSQERSIKASQISAISKCNIPRKQKFLFSCGYFLRLNAEVFVNLQCPLITELYKPLGNINTVKAQTSLICLNLVSNVLEVSNTKLEVSNTKENRISKHLKNRSSRKAYIIKNIFVIYLYNLTAY